MLGDTWYYVTALEESEAQTLQESGRLKLRFAKGVGRDLSVKLTYISEAEGGGWWRCSRGTPIYRS